MAVEKPKKPNSSQPKPMNSSTPPRMSINNSHSGGNQPTIPSPWLNPESHPQPHSEASFVEYLRWMRSPDADYKDQTKVQILQMAEQGVNYRERLKNLTNRIQLIAQNTFEVECPWRIRVGGHRGPESILLPAFDALGVPYIPSSTLRGVARTQAIREIMTQQQIKWKDAEKQVAPWFGSLDAKNPSERSGKVVFLDAYPLPSQQILTVDMANNIWKWENNSPKYAPNPNPFFSLKNPTFIIGLRLATGYQDNQILEKVKQWLIGGLQAGIGSQVNTGYGQLNLRSVDVPTPKTEFLRVEFILDGQLIHGRQKLRDIKQPYQKDRDGKFKLSQGKLRLDTIPDTEVRPVAFKSMLRYWFRVFSLGVLEPTQVQEWEAKIFGGITHPNQKNGWLMVRILQGKITQKEPQNNRDECGTQEGILTLNYSPEVPDDKKKNLQKLGRILTWLMFHLGGIGQGARRPCYSRNNAPWWRGSTLFPDREESFWDLPETPQKFQRLFKQRIQSFYQALKALGINFNEHQLKTCSTDNSSKWVEALDIHAKILVVKNKDNQNKGYALDTLHKYFHELEDQGDFPNAKNLCGSVKPETIPSPIWIADLDDYQVVTVFGANKDPRKEYLQSLNNSLQIFPL